MGVGRLMSTRKSPPESWLYANPEAFRLGQYPAGCRWAHSDDEPHVAVVAEFPRPSEPSPLRIFMCTTCDGPPPGWWRHAT